MNNTKACIIASFLLHIALSSAIADTPSPITVIRGEDIDDDERIVVTGSRLRRDEFTSNSPLQVIDGLDIRQDTVNLEELLELVDKSPGLTPAGDATTAGADTGLRGLDPDRRLVLVNGRRFVRTFGAAELEIESGIPDLSEHIERIEVLKGPTSATLYGAGATAGAINIVTDPSFRPFDVNDSWTLPRAQGLFGHYSISLQSQEACDATNGAVMPFWPYFYKHDYGLPKFYNDGRQLYYGSVEDGYQEGSFSALIGPHFGSDFTIDLDLYTDLTFDRLNRLIEQVQNDATVSPRDKAGFVGGLNFMASMGGAYLFSDNAWIFGLFDPETMYRNLRERGTGAAATVPAAAPAGDDRAPAPAENTGDAGDGAEGPVVPLFDHIRRPLSFNFDFSRCTPEQRDEALDLIQQRTAAGGVIAYFVDYQRREGMTEARYRQDMNQLNAARQLWDETTERLNELWQVCLNPEDAPVAAEPPAADATDAQLAADTSAPATDAAATQATDSPSSADTAATQVDEEATQQAGTGQRSSCGAYNLDLTYRWNLEVHVEQRERGADGSLNTHPAGGIGIDVYPRNEHIKIGLPFTTDNIKPSFDFFNGAQNQSPNRTFTDQSGMACLPLNLYGSVGKYTQDKLDFVKFGGLAGLSNGTTPGLGLGYTPRFGMRTPDGDDWNIAVDLGHPGVDDLTLGVKLRYEKTDSVYQVYPGLGGGMTFFDLPEETRNAIPEDFQLRLGGSYSHDNNFIQTFNFAEHNNFDLSFLDKVPGQLGWGNNDCGDAALPPQGAGYLTREETPVKTLEDRWAIERIRAPDATSPSVEFADPVIVGIIDTGIDWTHPDIAWENLWRNEDEIPQNGIDDDNNGFIDDIIGWNFTGENNRPWDHDGHGTFVAGLIAATHGNDIGIDGINPNAKIMVLKALNNFGRTRASYIAQAIMYGADNGARVVNLSVTGPGFPKVVQDAVDYAEAKGVLVVVAAGNRAEDIDTIRPAPLLGVLTVAATGPDDRRTVFSNVGNAIDIAAPGQDVVSLRAYRTDFMYNSADTAYVPGDAYLDDAYYRATGTSFAAPIVSGVASLVLGLQPNLTPAQLKRILEQSARDVETPGRDRFTGYGLIDAQAALAANPEFFIHAEIPAVRRLDLNGETFLQVFGIADANQFAGASLEIGQGDDPTSWTKTGNDINEPVRLDELGRIPAAQLSGAQTFTIRVVVRHQAGQSREARYVINLE